MMRGDVWVTSAVKEEEAKACLVLRESLRQTWSGKQALVLVSSALSNHSRNLLWAEFDHVVILEETWNSVNLSEGKFAKIYALNLKKFERCIYLDPFSLILKNSDHLFSLLDDDNQVILGGNEFIFGLKPADFDFEKALHLGDGDGGTGLEEILKLSSMKGVLEVKLINEEFTNRLPITEGLTAETYIVNLKERKADVNLKQGVDYGELEESILEMWRGIYSKNEAKFMNYSLRCYPLQGRHVKEPIAIVGMSCRYPRSENLDEFWNLLVKGEVITGQPPEGRWASKEGQLNGGFLSHPVDQFDGDFFGISRKELDHLDPQHRLLLEVVWEAVENAGMTLEELEGKHGGVFLGLWTNEFKNILIRSGRHGFYRNYMGNSIGAAAARISSFLGLTGPSISTESGCSSAMVGVHLACRSLREGESEFALACGVNLLLAFYDESFLPTAVSPDGRCKAFEAKADGFARAEGCGVLVLKRLSDAVRDNDKIWAVIRGSGIAQEGVSPSLGTPTDYCEALAMKNALRDAGVEPNEVSYVEAHGTGTVVGDPIEMSAIAKAYSRGRKEPLIVGSVKTNIGHTESCSGITGITKVALALVNEIIPQHRNFESLNPAVNLKAVPAVLPLQPVEWKKNQEKRRIAGVSSFGITGTDAHLIMEEAPEVMVSRIGPSLTRPKHLIKVSAKSEKALEILMEKYKNMLRTTQETFPDIAYSANAGRTNFAYRAVLIAPGNEDAVQALEKGKEMRGQVTKPHGKICFLFTGQGSQYHGMAKELYETSPVFRIHFNYCDKILQEKYNINIFSVIWSEQETPEVKRTLYSQTSIFCVQYALMKLWESWGVKPDFVLGHSLGEFCAAVCAGILTVEDAIHLVAHRSILIDKLPHGKMLVIRANKQKVEQLLKEYSKNTGKEHGLDFAAINSPEQTVLAGDTNVILGFADICKAKGVKCIILESTHAFHSKHMDSILHDYRCIADNIKFGKGLSSQYISGMEAKFISPSKMDSEYWVRHTRDKVKFMKAAHTAVQLGCTTFIEIGAQPILSALTMLNCEDSQITCLPSIRKTEGNWSTLLQTLGKLYLEGVSINWKGFDRLYPRKKVQLPNYPFLRKVCWPESVVPEEDSSHPLLGAKIPNATSSKLFQCGVTLDNLEYIKDHKLGTNVIFPGAAYIEMGLAAGHQVASGGGSYSTPLAIKDICILAPLAISENEAVQIQTVVQLGDNPTSGEDEVGFQIRFCSKVSTANETWRDHASARFIPCVTSSFADGFPNGATLLEAISTPGDVTIASEIYSTTGQHFGPSFTSLEEGWRLNDNLILKVKLPPPDPRYIIHPVVIDAMLQSYFLSLSKKSEKKGVINMPIKIGLFKWLGRLSSNTERYIWASPSSISLLDGDSIVLAVMSGVESVETTLTALEAVLLEKKKPLPDLWEEVWVQTSGLMENRVNLSSHLPPPLSTEKISLEQDADKMTANEELQKRLYYHMLKCLYDCGWRGESQIHQDFDEQQLFTKLNIHAKFHKYVGIFLKVFESEGILQKGEQCWKVSNQPPSHAQVEAYLKSDDTHLLTQFPSYSLVQHVSSNLKVILTGATSSHDVLFSTSDRKGVSSVEKFYQDFFHLFQMNESANEGVLKLVNFWLQKSDKDFILRICEIGAGTGLYTKLLTDQLEKVGVKFEYTFTDISPAFFPSAEKKFERFGEKMIFRKLNIEEDPVGQGFIPEYYDYLLAYDVLHTTKDIKDTISKVKTLLRPGGCFQILEQMRIDRLCSFIFASLEGYWNFKDFRLRPDHALLNKEKWKDLLTSVSFRVNDVVPCGFSHEALITAQKELIMKEIPSGENRPVWIVYHFDIKLATGIKRKLESAGRNVVFMEAGENFQEMDQGFRYSLRENSLQDFEAVMRSFKERKVILEGVLYLWPLDSQRISQEQLLQPLFSIAKGISHLDQKILPKLVALTRVTVPVGLNDDVSDICCSTISGFMKSLKHEHSELTCRTISVARGDLEDVNVEQEVFFELWKSKGHVQVVFQNGKRYSPKLILHKQKLSELPLELPVGGNRFQLVLPESKSIQDLKFRLLENLDLKEDEVEVKIKSCGLNFRDIFNILKPSDEFQKMNTIGMDFAGEIKRVGDQVRKWKVGDSVFGANLKGEAFPSHIKMSENDCCQVPPEVPLSAAASLPSVFITAYECLVKVAKLKSSEILLIHSASGGVGLTAIQIAISIGARVIATVGSSRKEKYLRSLGIEDIFNSRSINYDEEILRVTNGHGVDVVLNSLTSPGFKEATLKASAEGARFVEMSKLDIWTPEEVKALRPDVEYTVIDVSTLSRDDHRNIMKRLEKLLETKGISPLQYVSFQGVHIRQALEYLQKGKHIGKVVVSLPEVKAMETVSSTFNPRSSYLITGGLGGIGFQVAKWMLSCGAKHVLLAGRSSPGSEIQNEIDKINSTGANLIPVQVDISNIQKLKELFESFPTLKLPPLRGVMHFACTLSDGLVSNQNCWTSFSSTFKAKLEGTLNLHELTKHLNLEHFVLFSSMASSFGTPGQSNHAAGNSFLDAFAHYRDSLGLPVTSINWGPWSEFGAAKDLEFPGVSHISPSQGLSALHHILHSHKTQMSAINISSPILLSKFLPLVTFYLEKSVWESGSNVSESCYDTNSENFWTDYNSQKEAKEKTSVLQKYVCKILKNILKLEKNEVISSTAPFQQMGVDSLMFVEIRNLLQAMLGKKVELSMGGLRNNNTVEKLTLLLWNLIEKTGEDSSIPSMEQVSNLIRQDCQLDIKISAGDRKAKMMSDVKCVLLTGVTGTLGPYILAELSRVAQVSKIFCLVRGRNGKSGEERMNHVLEQHGLSSSVNKKNVHCIEGDVSLEKLGLGDTIWDKIVTEVDAIIHCAAKVDYTEYYVKTASTNDTRAANVEGTKIILKLACSGQGPVKQVYFASSILATPGDDKDGKLIDKWPETGDYDDISIFAYSVSKHVSDVLAKQAVDRGIPCKVFRFPIISGHSESGRFADDQGHLAIRYLYSLKTGMYPKDSLPLQVLPADFCAMASLKVFFDDKAPSDLYNMIHPGNGLDMEFVELAEKLGYSMKLVEFQEFSQYLRHDKDSSPFHTFREFYTLQDIYIKYITRSPGWLARKKDYFKSEKLAKLFPNLFDGIEPAVKYIERDLLFAKERGWFPRLGLDD